jgi:hypothetical protein
VDDQGNPALDSFESVREALWGMTNPEGKNIAFAQDGRYQVLQALAQLRVDLAPLRYGRLYFRETSGNGADFGLPSGPGGMVAFSRVLSSCEVVVVANTSTQSAWSGSVLVDLDLNQGVARRRIRYSNRGTAGSATVTVAAGARFWTDGQSSQAALPTASVKVSLAPMEVQVLA